MRFAPVLTMLGGIAIAPRRRRISCLWLLPLLMSAEPAKADVLSFDPPTVSVDIVDLPATYSFTVRLPPLFPNEYYGYSFIFLGSHQLMIDGFKYSDFWAPDDCSGCINPEPIYQSDIWLRSSPTDEAFPSTDSFMGTLSITIPVLDLGVYAIDVDHRSFYTVHSALQLPLIIDLEGQVSVHVIPEPATGTLLIIGAASIGFLRQKRRARNGRVHHGLAARESVWRPKGTG